MIVIVIVTRWFDQEPGVNSRVVIVIVNVTRWFDQEPGANSRSRVHAVHRAMSTSGHCKPQAVHHTMESLPVNFSDVSLVEFSVLTDS